MKEPTRYYLESVQLNFFQALAEWLNRGEWSWTKLEFRKVEFGEPGYDDAPYEGNWVWSPINYTLEL